MAGVDCIMTPITISTWQRPDGKTGPKWIPAYTLGASQAGPGPLPGVSGACHWTTTPMSAPSARPGARIAAYSHIHLLLAHQQQPERANPLLALSIISMGVIANLAKGVNPPCMLNLRGTAPKDKVHERLSGGEAPTAVSLAHSLETDWEAAA